ncbi:plasmid mobilization relaxosome protein MobC [Streptomyces sp. ISL-22]|uniref:plasmid mobilization relaxosome protein MobC n=1 Tax=unclassified Streptomyces TaxID=2593676 RepID=UPI001BEC1784|nr:MULTISPECIES: plasmid mobilization relaxosome protein MobC [unclassified Streptomyces]MBT2423497.1 plasmid mobilization relaxosome protein MobC [Streptomyces sp. ISL-24]MBT2432510.1 plasmid mobilization relaxosome protein MobC [Streptomyces sp. ISL-22]
MHDPHHELPTTQEEMVTPATDAPARYAAGPSKDGPNAEAASAPGVAEAIGRQGAPEGEQPADTAAPPALPRAAEAAALHRVARRRKPDPNGQRKERVDARYSIEEKKDILRMARSLNIAGAHYVGAVVMAHVHGDLALPGHRTPLDDYIDELTALRGEVAKIGHNINQIAKKLNSGGHPHPVDTAVLTQAERTLTTVGATVRHIATAANQAASKKVAQ